MKDYGDTTFITGMRAYAALAVVLIHAGGAGLRDISTTFDKIVNLGHVGVYVFFVISGFSVSVSFSASNNFFRYINKRIWRLLPSYYFWLIFTLLVVPNSSRWWQSLYVGIDSYNILMHFSFLSFLDYRITNSIIGVEWSVSIEMFWYFLIPVLLSLIQPRWFIISAALAVSIVLYLMANKLFGIFGIPLEHEKLAFLWSPFPYVVSYCLGVAAFRIRIMMPYARARGNGAFVILSACLLAYLVRPSGSYHVEFLFFSLLTFFLIVFGSRESLFFRIVFENKLVMFLGTISYGIYLSHVPLLQLFPDNIPKFWAFILLIVISVLASTVVYYLLERPGQRFGRKIGKWVLKNEV